MSEHPFVSVIIPTYNRAALLLEAVRSVCAQTYRPLEAVVVDDGSDDGTKESIEAYVHGVKQDDGVQVRYLRQTRQGGQVARNHGLRVANGTYVRFLDSDDWLFPQATTAQVDLLVATGAEVCYGRWRETLDGSTVAKAREGSFAADLDPDPVAALLGDQWCPPFCYLMLRETALRVGGWNGHYKALQDRDFINRIAFTGARFVTTSEMIGCHRHHTGPRVSRDDGDRWLRFMKETIDDGIEWLDRNSQWTKARRQAAALSLFRHARRYYGVDRTQFNACVNAIGRISPEFRAPGVFYPVVASLLGYWRAETFRRACRRLLGRVRSYAQT